MRLTWSWRLPTAWYLTAAKNSLEGTPNFSSAAILKWQIFFLKKSSKSPKTKIGTWFNVFRLFFVCFILLLGGWLRLLGQKMGRNSKSILSKSRKSKKVCKKFVKIETLKKFEFTEIMLRKNLEYFWRILWHFWLFQKFYLP